MAEARQDRKGLLGRALETRERHRDATEAVGVFGGQDLGQRGSAREFRDRPAPRGPAPSSSVTCTIACKSCDQTFARGSTRPDSRSCLPPTMTRLMKRRSEAHSRHILLRRTRSFWSPTKIPSSGRKGKTAGRWACSLNWPNNTEFPSTFGCKRQT